MNLSEKELITGQRQSMDLICIRLLRDIRYK
jgi:hypothetical protein